MAANSSGVRMAATEPVTPRITRAMGRPLTWHNAEEPEEPPCVPPSQGGKKDQTPPTFPPLRRGGRGGESRGACNASENRSKNCGRKPCMPRLSTLAENLTAETAFTVLVLARNLKALGKDVVELEIGDSPFPSTPHAKAAGIQAIEENQTGYCPSLGLPRLRAAAATFVASEFGYPAGPENIVVASGAKPFEQYFAEALLDPGDGVLVFSPHFPTYIPNLERRQARAVLAPLRVEHAFRPRVEDVKRFLATDPRPRAIFLNSPHNPTGGVATREDLAAIADLVRDTDLM